MSASLEVKKDALVNLVKQHYKAMKKKENKIDNTMETIMLQVVKEEAERRNIDMSKIDSIEAITKLIDVELIKKIEAYISINKKLSEPETAEDIIKLEKMSSANLKLKKGFTKFIKNHLDDALTSEIEATQVKFRADQKKLNK